MSKPKVHRVAVKTPAGKVHTLPPPASHADVRRTHGIKGPTTRGFLDQNGSWLTREAAAEVASASGQIRQGKAEVASTGRLHSHNLKPKGTKK